MMREPLRHIKHTSALATILLNYRNRIRNSAQFNGRKQRKWTKQWKTNDAPEKCEKMMRSKE